MVTVSTLAFSSRTMMRSTPSAMCTSMTVSSGIVSRMVELFNAARKCDRDLIAHFEPHYNCDSDAGTVFHVGRSLGAVGELGPDRLCHILSVPRAISSQCDPVDTQIPANVEKTRQGLTVRGDGGPRAHE